MWAQRVNSQTGRAAPGRCQPTNQASMSSRQRKPLDLYPDEGEMNARTTREDCKVGRGGTWISGISGPRDVHTHHVNSPSRPARLHRLRFLRISCNLGSTWSTHFPKLTQVEHPRIIRLVGRLASAYRPAQTKPDSARVAHSLSLTGLVSGFYRWVERIVVVSRMISVRFLISFCLKLSLSIPGSLFSPSLPSRNDVMHRATIQLFPRLLNTSDYKLPPRAACRRWHIEFVFSFLLLPTSLRRIFLPYPPRLEYKYPRVWPRQRPGN